MLIERNLKGTQYQIFNSIRVTPKTQYKIAKDEKLSKSQVTQTIAALNQKKAIIPIKLKLRNDVARTYWLAANSESLELSDEELTENLEILKEMGL